MFDKQIKLVMPNTATVIIIDGLSLDLWKFTLLAQPFFIEVGDVITVKINVEPRLANPHKTDVLT